MTGRELLRYLASLRGGVGWDYVRQLSERFRCDLKSRIQTLSRGNRQKVGLIQAFMSRPELIIMDEPTAGLDPLMQQEFYALVKEVKAEGRTVFISSHCVPEVERICDRVGILRRGELVTVENVRVLKDRGLHHLGFRFAHAVGRSALPGRVLDLTKTRATAASDGVRIVAGLPGVHDVLIEGSMVKCTIHGSPDALVKAAAVYEIVGLKSDEASLEDVFLAYYGESDSDVG